MSNSTQAQQPRTGQRELMFCHECNDEWYRDQHGIICPECGSEFTEVIEEDNDPRDSAMHGDGYTDDDDDDASMPSLEETGGDYTRRTQNPFRQDDDDDPPEQDISAMRVQNVGPGRFQVSATIHRTISPAALAQGGNNMNGMDRATSFLAELMRSRVQAQPQAEAGDGSGGSAPRQGQDGGPHVHRFTYSSNARLTPRDGDNPGPRQPPVDDLNAVLTSLFEMIGDVGAAPGGAGHGAGHHHAHAHDHDAEDGPINPFMNFFAALGMAGGQHGDFVTSQAAMDRIVSQLMEQTATSNAPGPAAQADIDALPQKDLTMDMLGDDGQADCSICMDEVTVGEKVTELPCKHWFHGQCVAAWLKEHDTCPHCRKGITKTNEAASRDASATQGNATSSGSDPTASMPGAFSGAGTSSNPYVIPGSSPPSGPSNQESQSQAPSSNANENAASGEGVAERLRRSWWP